VEGLDPRVIAGLPASALLAIALIAFARDWVYSRRNYEAMRAQLQSQIDAKDAALVRKDAIVESLHAENKALVEGIVEKFVPALARSALILEKFHTDTTVRRAE
jgi:hypothetical protein